MALQIRGNTQILNHTISLEKIENVGNNLKRYEKMKTNVGQDMKM